MAARVLYHPAADREYAKACRWYAKKGILPVDEFRLDIANAIERIAADPQQFPLFRRHFRFVRTKHYRYVLYFRIVDATSVLVMAVAHGSRKPGYWVWRTRK